MKTWYSFGLQQKVELNLQSKLKTLMPAQIISITHSTFSNGDSGLCMSVLIIHL